MIRIRANIIKKLGFLWLISLAVAYCTNLFSVQKQFQWQWNSEALVWGRAVNAVNHGIGSDAGLLGAFDKQELGNFPIEELVNDADKGEFGVYRQQSGLQGTVCAISVILIRKLGGSADFAQNVLWLVTTSLMIYVMLLFAKWLALEMGGGKTITYIGVLSCLFLAPWMQQGLANTYWVLWTMMTPMVITAYWGRCIKTEVFIRGWKAEKLLFLAIFIRFLCGYEFTTTIMLASEIPIVYYFIEENDLEKRKKLFAIAFEIGVLELVAFALSFCILGIQNMQYSNTGFIQAMGTVIGAAKFRTGSFSSAENIASYTGDLATIETVQNASGWSVLKKYLLSDVKIWGAFDFKKLLFIAILIIVIRKIVCKGTKKAFLLQLYLLLISTIPAISWYYIGYGHAVFHEHVDYILWCIPFLPVCLALVCKNISDIYEEIRCKTFLGF